jgi:hypothetical protein
MLLASATSGMAAVAGMLGMSALAAAAVTPSVTATIQNSSNANISAAPIGSAVHAVVTVASSTASTSPIGTVDFNLYSSQNCTGSPLAQTGVALVNGSASSSAANVAAGGLSYKVHYNGQGDFTAAADSDCVSISASQISTALGLSLSNASVQAGSFVYAIPNLTGETGTASGTIVYKAYSNNSCTTLALDAGSKAVTNGSTPNSDSWQFITPGTYYWQAVYSGDLNNASATSSCNASGTVLTVVATTTQFSPTLSAQLSNANVLAGSSVYESATLSNASSNAGGSVSYDVYTNDSCTAGAIDAGTKTVTNAAVPNSNSIVFNNAGTYYWRAVYSGDSANASATSSCRALTVSSTSTTPAAPGTISGTVYNDLNKNDKQGSGEPGLSGWTVWLHKAATSSSQNPWWKVWGNKSHDYYDDPIIATATTDGNGNYSFGNLSSGTYFVEESVQAGWKQTSDDVKVVLSGTKTSADVDFSNVQKNATSTPKDNNGKGNNGNDNRGDNGDHNGWFKFNGNVFGWFKLGSR